MPLVDPLTSVKVALKEGGIIPDVRTHKMLNHAVGR
jgi:hypothetical protein